MRKPSQHNVEKLAHEETLPGVKDEDLSRSLKMMICWSGFELSMEICCSGPHYINPKLSILYINVFPVICCSFMFQGTLELSLELWMSYSGIFF